MPTPSHTPRLRCLPERGFPLLGKYWRCCAVCVTGDTTKLERPLEVMHAHWVCCVPRFQRLRMGYYDGRPCKPDLAIRQASQPLSITFCPMILDGIPILVAPSYTWLGGSIHLHAS